MEEIKWKRNRTDGHAPTAAIPQTVSFREIYVPIAA
jgi:hypothetical protein